MNRFQKEKRRTYIHPRLLSIVVFILVLILFLSGLSSVSETTSRKEEESLRNAILQSAVHCYALEGFYPEDLSYLKEHYGITYDEKKYIVSYEVIGSNLMPKVMIIPLKEKGERTS